MKTCSKCGLSKKEVEFSIETTRNGSLRARRDCKLCRSSYNAKWRESNPDYSASYYTENKGAINRRMVESNKTRRRDRYAIFSELRSGPCVDCHRVYHPHAMDFDHRNPTEKLMGVSLMVKRFFAWPTIMAEIAKCDLVCACCHRLRTYKGQNCYKTRQFEQHRTVLDKLKSSTPCLDCGGYFKPCQMDFDHVNSSTKVANVARLVESTTEKLVAELVKCHAVCANCHRVRSSTGVRPINVEHSTQLVTKFRELMSVTLISSDRRFSPFPSPDLLGVIPDKDLALQVGMSPAMVAWHRRRTGISPTVKGSDTRSREIH